MAKTKFEIDAVDESDFLTNVLAPSSDKPAKDTIISEPVHSETETMSSDGPSGTADGITPDGGKRKNTTKLEHRLTIDIPESLYRRMQLFKLDSKQHSSLKGITVDAIEAYIGGGK